METFVIELTDAERRFLLVVVEEGFKAMGISTLVGKLKSLQPKPAPVVEPAPPLEPAPAVEPAVVVNDDTLDPVPAA